MNHELRFRQVHLDFHTSHLVPGIGSEFDPDQFVHTLKEAAVDSITCFSRCHHGYIYHDTKFPFRHPNLTCNLLEQQIRACHANDIRVPIYITVGWDHLQAGLHPEWVEIDETGKCAGRGPQGAYGWTNLDFASPYVDFVIDQTREVMDIFGDEVDGFFFDIIFQHGVHSKSCLERFAKLGWDPTDKARQKQMRSLLVNELTDRVHGAIREKNKDCTVFFNSGHVGPAFRAVINNFSHLEVESLPTGGWGYMHFPITARYTRTLGHDFLAMTGKFSETWGHFNSYKNPAALEFECLQSLAQGGKCSVGDQLHPAGVLDKATYDLIGPVYRLVRDLEPWCSQARVVTEIGVLNAEAFDTTSERMDPRNLGVCRMLIEGRHQFDLIDTQADWDAYKVIVLPDVTQLDAEASAKLSAYVAKGGAVIASSSSIVGTDGEVLTALRGAVASVEGDLEFSPDFIRPAESLGLDSATDFVMYEKGLKLTAAAGAEVLGTISVPFFNRTWNTFISHAHSPVKEATDTPAILKSGNVVVFAHPIFTTYGKHSMSFHRDAVLAVLRQLLPTPLVSCPGPTSLQATITKQGDRYIVHLLHYIPERRGLNFDIIEDRMPVLATEVEARVSATKALSVPDGTELAIEATATGVKFKVPSFEGHFMVSLE